MDLKEEIAKLVLKRLETAPLSELIALADGVQVPAQGPKKGRKPRSSYDASSAYVLVEEALKKHPEGMGKAALREAVGLDDLALGKALTTGKEAGRFAIQGERRAAKYVLVDKAPATTAAVKEGRVVKRTKK